MTSDVNMENILIDNSSKVLLVEDSEVDRISFQHQLAIMGFTIHDTASPIEAVALFKQHDYVMVFIHIGSSPMKSLEICRWIRANSTVPILMLIHRDEVIDEIVCMTAGSDDYISMPFDLRILKNRISQQLKRSETQRAAQSNIFRWGPLKIDLIAHQFTFEDREIILTNTEFKLLRILIENPFRVFSREQILEAIGASKGAGSDHIIDTHASRLRRKIIENGGPNIINVVRSVGFRLADPRDSIKVS